MIGNRQRVCRRTGGYFERIDSNEADLLNRIVLGMTAKQYREKHGIQKGEPIRPYMTVEETKLMEWLQMLDVGFQYSIPDFQERKKKLEQLARQWWDRHIPQLTA